MDRRAVRTRETRSIGSDASTILGVTWYCVELRGIEPLTMPWAGPNVRKCSYTPSPGTGSFIDDAKRPVAT